MVHTSIFSIKAQISIINNMENANELIAILKPYGYFFEKQERKEYGNGIQDTLIFMKKFDVQHRENLDYSVRTELNQIIPHLHSDCIIVEEIDFNGKIIEKI